MFVADDIDYFPINGIGTSSQFYLAADTIRVSWAQCSNCRCTGWIRDFDLDGPCRSYLVDERIDALLNAFAYFIIGTQLAIKPYLIQNGTDDMADVSVASLEQTCNKFCLPWLRIVRVRMDWTISCVIKQPDFVGFGISRLSERIEKAKST